MQSFKAAAAAASLNNSDMYCQTAFYLRRDEGIRNSSRLLDVVEPEHPVVFHQHDAVDFSTNGFCNLKSSNVAVHSSSHFGAINANIGGSHQGSSTKEAVADAGQLLTDKVAPAPPPVVGSMGVNNGHCENWGESAMADTSQQTETSTDVDTDDKNQNQGVENKTARDSTDQCKEKTGDQKTLRRLAQNREAARKSRLRKKAYVQQLESGRIKLAQLEQELERARQKGIFIASGLPGEQGSQSVGGALAFDMHYSRWLDDHQWLINDLRSAMNCHVPGEELRIHVDNVMSHHDEFYRLKSMAAKGDIFHVLMGTWMTPIERLFMWLGGFRSSEILKILVNHLEPLTDQQLVGICNLQQSSQQAEDALTQGVEALQLSLVDALSSNCLGTCSSSNIADYMEHMAIAMSKLATLENLVHQADLLRQQTLQRLNKILTTHQSARSLLVIHDYKMRLRALSSLWLARPKNS